MDDRPGGPVRFGAFEFDPASGELRKRGMKARLAPKATILLRALLEEPLRARTREELQRQLWPDQLFLDFEHGLNKVVHSLRETLGETGSHSRFIETDAADGYRFAPDWVRPALDPERSPGREVVLSVLPIRTRGAGPELRFLAFRLTSELIDHLCRFPEIRVIAEKTARGHHSVESYSRAGSSGIEAVLSGYVISFDKTVLFRVELTDRDGSQIFGYNVERMYPVGHDEANGMIEEIAEQIRKALHSLPVRGWRIDETALIRANRRG